MPGTAATTGSLESSPASEAIPRLMEESGGKILRLGLKFCGNRDEAEEVVQETFLQAYRKWGQFEGRSDPTSWLYTIATRTCQRLHRRRAGEPERIESLDRLLPSGDAVVTSLPVAADDPFDDQLRQEAAEVVDHALARLPFRFRMPLVLKEIAELSLREIAAILDVKESTVKTRVHRARLALRAELTEELARRTAAPADHPHRVCLDLLRAKMDALDRGVPFPVARDELCARCRALVDSLDLTVEACRWIQGGELSESLRRSLMARFERPAG